MQRLSHFDQASLRTYKQIVLAFLLEETASAQIIFEHLRTSLTRVGQQFRVLASNLHLEKSRFGEEVFLRPSSADIPLVADIGGTSYASLAARGFPAHEFVRPEFDLNNTLKLNEGPVPVAHARLKFIHGGLLLFLAVHVSDGYGLGQFVEAFAAASRGESIPSEPSSTVLNLPQDPEISSATLLTLSEQCPEFEVLLNPNPLPSLPDILPGGIPSEAIPSEVKIFVFKIDRIAQLRNKARCGSEQGAPPSGDADVAKLFVPVDFRLRFHDETLEYFGNAIVTIPTETSVDEVMLACGQQNLPALARLVDKITTTIADVDQKAVLRREALFRRLGDCRRLALSQDRRLPGQLQANSWRYFGANFVWTIPGMGTRKPQCVRRIQGSVSPGSALILPLNSESEDDDWMDWVDRVID